MMTVDGLVIFQGAAVVLIGFVLRGVIAANKKLNDLNGGLGRLNVWKDSHDKQDDERHQEVVAELKDIWTSLKK